MSAKNWPTVEVIEAIKAVEATKVIKAAAVLRPEKSLLRTSVSSRHLNSALFSFKKKSFFG
jgi:predicted hydrolase (HD superfamily)